MSPAKKPLPKNFKRLVSAALSIALLDGLGKYLALQGIFSNAQTGILTTGFFANRGVAFSLPVPLPIALIITMGVTGMLIQQGIKNRKKYPLPSAFALAAACGAINNGADRLLHGWTTDYLFFFNRLAINLSDILVVGGIIGYIWYNEKSERPPTSSGTL